MRKNAIKKNLCFIPSDFQCDRFITSICCSPLIKAARRSVMWGNRLIKARTSHLRRPGILSWIYDNVFRRFARDIKSPSVQKLFVTSAASILTGTHRELDIALIPLQFHKGRDPGSPREPGRPWLREADRVWAQNVNRGGECEKLQRERAVAAIGFGRRFELMPTDSLPWVRISSGGRCLAGQLLAFQFEPRRGHPAVINTRQSERKCASCLLMLHICSSHWPTLSHAQRPETPLAATRAEPRFSAIQHTSTAEWRDETQQPFDF